jgi:acetyl esterase
VTGLDPQAAAWLDQVREAGAPSYMELGPVRAREVVDAAAPVLFGPPDAVTAVEEVDAGGVPARLYRPEAEGPGAVVYFHGGGWVVGSLDSHDGLCRTLAARSGRAVISCDYRLAPEHPYPAAVEDAWVATRWAAAAHGTIAVAGDSAGGHLAAVAALRARDAGLPLALQVLVYPVTDCAFDTPTHREHGDATGLTTEMMRWFWEQFLPDPSRGAEPEVSPLRAPSLAGVAPALVLVASHDPLRSEGDAYAHRLAEEGVPVTLSCYDGQIHGFVRMPAVIDRAQHAIDELAAALRAALA